MVKFDSGVRVGPRCSQIKNFLKVRSLFFRVNQWHLQRKSGCIYLENKKSSSLTVQKPNTCGKKPTKTTISQEQLSPQQRVYFLLTDSYFLFAVDAFFTHTSLPYVIFIYREVSSCTSRVTSCLPAVTTDPRRLADNSAPWRLCDVRLAGKRPRA